MIISGVFSEISTLLLYFRTMLSTQSFQRTYSSVNNTIHGEPFGRDGSMSGVFYAFYGIRYTEVRSFEDIRKNGISVNTRPKSMTAEDLYNLIPLLKDYEQSQ
jgi:hypothetical protein